MERVMTGRLAYKDREEAGHSLAARLNRYAGAPGAIVLGVPRGGVLVASALAEALRLEMDALICRKLRCTSDHSLAAGAATETGLYFVNPDLPGAEALDARHLREQLAFARRAIAEDEVLWRPALLRAPLRGRTVILVDEGASTGATIRAAARSARAEGCARLVLGLPVAARELVDRLTPEADETVVLHAPADFVRTADHYASLPVVSDEALKAALEGSARFRRNNA